MIITSQTSETLRKINRYQEWMIITCRDLRASNDI
jgi:hypothetical protein